MKKNTEPYYEKTTCIFGILQKKYDKNHRIHKTQSTTKILLATTLDDKIVLQLNLSK